MPSPLIAGLTRVDAIFSVLSGLTRNCRETKTKREKGLRMDGEREGRRELVDKSTPFFFSFLFLFFLKKNNFFLLSPFLLSNCCHVFNIRCNLFQTLGWGWMGRRGAHTGAAAIFTPEPDTKTGKHSAQGKSLM